MTLVPHYLGDTMKTILVAVDFSNASTGVLEMAVRLAKAFGADLQLFHVVEPEPSYSAYGFTPDEFPAMTAFQEEAKRRAATKLDEMLDRIRQEIPSATSRLVQGSPLHALSEEVTRSGADFVVLGSHGHGVIASFLLGSVAEGMVRKATVPTLVVPAPRE
jgi:nucleotide-binding universal stress UspA family protein